MVTGTRLRFFWLVVCAASWWLPAAELKPETAAAFDRYVKNIEGGLLKPLDTHNFLWLDQHPKEKSIVWFNQRVITAHTITEEISVPDGLIQDWIGTTFLSDAKLERVRDVVLDYPNYKVRFKEQVSESRLIKREGDRFDAFLRLHKRQVLAVALNADVSAQYTLLDPHHACILCRSTHIAEVKGDEHGYLWRMNLYWRLVEADQGVYVEVELVSLSSEPGGKLHPGRFLNGFVRGFPREFVEGLIEGLQQAFPFHR
jgi:hypothetical protein